MDRRAVLKVRTSTGETLPIKDVKSGGSLLMPWYIETKDAEMKQPCHQE
jgi:hypothetical protein